MRVSPENTYRDRGILSLVASIGLLSTAFFWPAGHEDFVLHRSSTQAADVNKTTNRPLNHSVEEWGGKTNPTKSRLIQIDPSVSISKECSEDIPKQFV